MTNGLFLQGGGAKGAFQAGALYALREAGLRFSIISGTSIGAINGYYLYMGQEEAMKRFYLEADFSKLLKEQVITDTISNEDLITALSQLEKKESAVSAFYINYVHIKDRKMYEVQKDFASTDKNTRLDAVRASSLLPFSLPKGFTHVMAADVASKYGYRVMGACFEEDVLEGKYENRSLDGGILNNLFMEPFAKHRVDKLYLLSLHNELPIPDYLRRSYRDEQLVLIQREKIYGDDASLNFTQPFMSELFAEGYKAAKAVL